MQKQLAIFPSVVISFAISFGACAGEAPEVSQPAISVMKPLEASAIRTESAPAKADQTAQKRAMIRTIIEQETLGTKLPPDLAEAVVSIESNFNAMAVGSVGEIGLMQIRPKTAEMLGFEGDASDLARPEINIRYGVRYLAKAWRLTNGDLCRTLMKYRAGHGEETISPLSAVYCSRAKTYLASISSSLAGDGRLFAETDRHLERQRPAESIKSLSGSVRLVASKRGTQSASQAFWRAHEARVRLITASVRSKWQRVASSRR